MAKGYGFSASTKEILSIVLIIIGLILILPWLIRKTIVSTVDETKKAATEILPSASDVVPEIEKIWSIGTGIQTENLPKASTVVDVWKLGTGIDLETFQRGYEAIFLPPSNFQPTTLEELTKTKVVNPDLLVYPDPAEQLSGIKNPSQWSVWV